MREVANGGTAMFPEVAIRVVDAFRRKTQPPPGDVSLTPQEIRLLKLLTEGHQNKTAAAELGISIHPWGFIFGRFIRNCTCILAPKPSPRIAGKMVTGESLELL